MAVVHMGTFLLAFVLDRSIYLFLRFQVVVSSPFVVVFVLVY